MVYLDHSATTYVDEEVMETFVKANAHFWGNPSSLHHFGVLAEQVLLKSNRQILDLLNAHDHQVIYTSGATESNNLALKGLAQLHPNGHIVTTKIEHPSVYEVCLQLEKQGFKLSYLDVTKPLDALLAELEALMTKETFLVSCMHVNSEMGLVLPIKEIGEVVAKHPKAKYHVDAVQSIGKYHVDLADMHIDLLSLSAHKIHGIKGVGALIAKNRTQLAPQIHGGGQMKGIRSGTENAPGAASLAKALRLVCEGRKTQFKTISQLHAYTVSQLEQVPGLAINSRFEKQSPYILNFCVAGVRGETLVHALEAHEVYLSSKSACSSKSSQASYVLLALGFDVETSTQSVRISFSHQTTQREVDQFIQALKQEVAHLRR